MSDTTRTLPSKLPSGTAADRAARMVYVTCIRPYLSNPLTRQRVKLLWHVWGYLPLLTLPRFRWRERLSLLRRFLVVDWHVLHAHRPAEITAICRALTRTPPRPDEVVVEAGCWKGGSTAKFSIVCRHLGYGLRVYDSFEGVEALTEDEKRRSFDFSGEYRSSEQVLLDNVGRFGERSVCTIQRGWFRETLAREAVPQPVKLAYIDCDVAKGTREALTGIVPSLVRGGIVFSQDFHIVPVRETLCDPATWSPFGRGVPAVRPLGRQLAALSFE